MSSKRFYAGFAMALGLAMAGVGLAGAADLSSLMGGDPREAPDPASAKLGAGVYAARCAGCHESGVGRAPARFMLSMMPARAIDRALSDGVMKPMAAGLTDQEKRSVAEFLAQKRMGPPALPPVKCAAGASPFDYAEAPPLDGWGLGQGNAHAIAPGVTQLDFAHATGPKLQWAVAFPDAVRARSQATLGGGAIYVGSHDGTVFALDRQTGCARWMFHAGAEVRTGVTLTPWTPGDRKAQPLALFGDLVGNVYAVDAITGAQVWKIRADSHPNATITGTPTLFENKLLVPVSSLEEATAADPKYACCTFRGSLIAYDVRTGSQLWQTFTVDAAKPLGTGPGGVARLGPSGIAIWSAPTIDAKRRRVYVATGDNYSSPTTPYSDAVMALDIDSGHVLWSFQATQRDAWNTGCVLPGRLNCPAEDGPDYDFGSAPILADASGGTEFLLAGQKSGIVYGLDPATGALRWKTKVGRGGASGGVHFGMSAQGGRLFVPITDLGKANPDGPAMPGVNALDIATGRLLWRFESDVCRGKPECNSAGFGSVPTAMGRQLLLGGNDGRLRALDVENGAVIWEFDTNQPVMTLNGVTAHGGAIAGGHGPIAYKGMMYVASGYGFSGQAPGNVLLAFRAN